MISKSQLGYRWNNHLTIILKRIFFFFVFSPLVVLPLPSHCQRDIFSLKVCFLFSFVVVVFGGRVFGTWWCLYFDAGSTTKIIFYLNFVWNLRFNFLISYFLEFYYWILNLMLFMILWNVTEAWCTPWCLLKGGSKNGLKHWNLK